ncbi:MAG: N-acetyltransferase [Planctomycetota bacterium]
MSELVVRRVESSRQKEDFLQFPWSLYRGDPNWVPPLRTDQKEMVGYRHHPFYEKNSAQTFLAYRSGEVCGRIAAILNREHIERHGERRGFFGFFECVDDQEAANGLFDAVRQWLSERDVSCLRGPVNPSMNYTVGLLIDGFDSPPVFMMPYNPTYYPRLIEGYGFRKVQDLYAFWGNLEMQPAVIAKFRPIVEQIKERYSVVLRPLDTSRFQEDVEAFLDLYNRSMASTWAFVPMSPGEVRHMAKSLRHLIVPELAVVAEVEGKMVGATFALPDYNPRIRRIDGRLFPFGFLRLVRKKHEIKRVRVLAANVLPEYHRMGIGLVLLDGLAPKGAEWGTEEAEFSWVLESNLLSRNALEKGGAKLSKTYRLYDLDKN